MNDQKILDNAPWGATHVNHKNKYFWFDGDTQFVYKRKTDEWLMTFYHENKLDLVRSLADIASIAELEKELSTIIVGLFSEEELAIRDLERMALGIKGSIDFYQRNGKSKMEGHIEHGILGKRPLDDPDSILIKILQRDMDALNAQAKALKEEG